MAIFVLFILNVYAYVIHILLREGYKISDLFFDINWYIVPNIAAYLTAIGLLHMFKKLSTYANSQLSSKALSINDLTSKERESEDNDKLLTSLETFLPTQE